MSLADGMPGHIGCHEGPEGLSRRQTVEIPNRAPCRTCGTSLARHLSDVGVFAGQRQLVSRIDTCHADHQRKAPFLGLRAIDTHGGPLASPIAVRSHMSSFTERASSARTRQNRLCQVRVAIALILVFLPTAAVAEPSQGVVTMLLGQATLTRRAPATPQPLRFKDDLFAQDRINTGERSLARVLLGGKAVATVRELSVFTISAEARDQTVRLTSGKLALSVARSRMRPGEAIEIRTPNAIAAIRGTVVI